MTGLSTSLLALIIVALGFVAVILSFLVTDQKKARLALILAGIIVFIGLVQWTKIAFNDFQTARRMRQYQRQSEIDWESLREKLKNQTTPPAAQPAAPVKKK